MTFFNRVHLSWDVPKTTLNIRIRLPGGVFRIVVLRPQLCHYAEDQFLVAYSELRGPIVNFQWWPNA
jgi:hypothetical protein